MQTSFQAFLPSHLAFFHYVIFVLFACHKVNRFALMRKWSTKYHVVHSPMIMIMSTGYMCQFAPKLQNLQFLKIPPMCSPLLNKNSFLSEILIFPLAPIGVFPPGSAHARPSAQPPSTPSEICLRMCLVRGGIKSFSPF
jgi:hypothetical protein